MHAQGGQSVNHMCKGITHIVVAIGAQVNVKHSVNIATALAAGVVQVEPADIYRLARLPMPPVQPRKKYKSRKGSDSVAGSSGTVADDSVADTGSNNASGTTVAASASPLNDDDSSSSRTQRNSSAISNADFKAIRLLSQSIQRNTTTSTTTTSTITTTTITTSTPQQSRRRPAPPTFLSPDSEAASMLVRAPPTKRKRL